MDDIVSIHDDFRGLIGLRKDTTELDDIEADIFGTGSAGAAGRGAATQPVYELAFARQGQEALALAQEALRQGAPFALAFVDMRMPPGWDGLTTLQHLWAADPLLQCVICSAYADQSWNEITARFGPTDRLLILKKPFDPVEVRQLACAMTEKWNQRAEAAAGEAALRRSEARNRALLNAIPDTIVRIGWDGTVLDAKLSKERAPIAGEGAIVGRQLREAFGDELAARLWEHMQLAVKESDSAVGFEYTDRNGERPRHREVRIVASGQNDAVVIIRDVTEQRHAEHETADQRAREAMLRAQTETLAALSAPLIPITDEIVVMPLIGELDPTRLQRVQEALTGGIVARRSRVAILDVTGVTNLGPPGAEGLTRIAQAVKLLGASVILTGIQPSTAVSLVNSRCDLQGVATKQSLQEGIAHALRTQEQASDLAHAGARTGKASREKIQ